MRDLALLKWWQVEKGRFDSLNPPSVANCLTQKNKNIRVKFLRRAQSAQKIRGIRTEWRMRTALAEKCATADPTTVLLSATSSTQTQSPHTSPPLVPRCIARA